MGFQKMDDRFNLYGYLKPWVVYKYILILFVKRFVVRSFMRQTSTKDALGGCPNTQCDWCISLQNSVH